MEVFLCLQAWSCPITSFIETDDSNFFERICLALIESLAKSEPHRWLLGWCYTPGHLYISEWHNLIYEHIIREGINSHQIQVQIYVLLRCPELSQAIHICGIRWHFYNNSKLIVNMYPLDYSTCQTLILPMVAVLLVYTILDCEVFMRETHSKQWYAFLESCEI